MGTKTYMMKTTKEGEAVRVSEELAKSLSFSYGYDTAVKLYDDKHPEPVIIYVNGVKYVPRV